jgi:hypothetical protein
MPTCYCCRRPAERRSRFCWHRDCPGAFAWCDGCERVPALPGFPVCGPCALELARDPPARLRVYAPPRPAGVGRGPKSAGGDVRKKGQLYRARVWVGGRGGGKVSLGYFRTPGEADAAIEAYRRAA